MEKNKVEYLSNFIRDNIEAAGRTGGVIGFSGGIDSAVCLLLMKNALGSENVFPMFMPHRIEQLEGKELLEDMCRTHNIELKTIDLTAMMSLFMENTDTDDKILLGNFAARMRSAYLYNEAAVNNSLVVNTSNKSERMLGYCTKWGDQVGDLSPIGKLFKQEVYVLAGELGVNEEIIKAKPSAGFYEGQEDENELGVTYEELDEILVGIEGGSIIEGSAKVKKVKDIISSSEHKRCFPVLPEN